MIMVATVREVRDNSLLVIDRAAGQNVVVHTNNTRCFSRGDRIFIWHNGVMAQSFPPQISAIRIRRVFPGGGCR